MPSPNRTAWLFLAPHATLFTVWTLLPLLAITLLSLYDWSLLGDRRFVGSDNYRELVSDQLFWRALGNTTVFALVIVPSAMAGGLGLALALNEPWRGRSLLRSIFYAPSVISGVAVAAVAAWTFNEHYGVLNGALSAVGLPRPAWLSSQQLAFPALVVVTLWLRVGFCMIVYLAGLQEIPRELYEAAHCDGASAWDRFRFVTWPMLHRTTTLLFVLNTVFSFHMFDLAFVMTAGGPAFTTTFLVQYLYESGFSLQRQGYAAAIAVTLYGIMLCFTAVAWWQQRRKGQA